jgi:hypothetical protein
MSDTMSRAMAGGPGGGQPQPGQGGAPQPGPGGQPQPGGAALTGPQAGAHFQQYVMQTYQQVQGVIQTIRGVPGVDQQKVQQGAQMMGQGWMMIADAIKQIKGGQGGGAPGEAPGGGAGMPPGGMPPGGAPPG